MIKHYIKVAIRNLIRNKTYAGINILGLTVGITCAMAIFIWIKHELSFDAYHKDAEQIHQAYFNDINVENSSRQYTVSPIIANILKEEFPEVINTARRTWLGRVSLQFEDIIFEEEDGCSADPSMFDMLSYKFLSGNAKTAFVNINSIVLTKALAIKYFGQQNPMGLILTLNKEHSLEVTGVIEDLPANTEFEFDFLTPLLFSQKLGSQLDGGEFNPCNFLTFVVLDQHASLDDLNQKIQERIRIDLDNRGITFAISLIPIMDIHLFESGGKQKVYIFSIIGILILIIACFNFMNLSIALSAKRAKEIGIRKVSGSRRMQLIAQFFSESFIIVFIAIDIALILVNPLISYFNQITNNHIAVDLYDPYFLLILAGILLFTSFAAGFYPAMYLSSFNPLTVLKDRFGMKKGKTNYRKYFIGVQFGTSILFLVCTIIMRDQLQSIKNFDYGVHKENIIYTSLNDNSKERFATLKQELSRIPEIATITTADYLPTAISIGNFTGWGVNDGVNRRILETKVGYDFLELFDLQLAEGRFYNKEISSDKRESIVVNEAAIRKVGLENALNNSFYYMGRDYTLIGIIKDFQHQSPVNNIPEPVIFRISEEGQHYMFLRLQPSVSDHQRITNLMASVKNTLAGFDPDSPVDFAFVDDFKTGRERMMETRQEMIFFVSVLSIFIACLGLLGLSALMNEKRTKEIGIRKVMGASITQITTLLSKEFIVIALFANLLAWPIAWYAMHVWLQNFTHRIDISIWPFLFGGVAALAIAILTVSSQAIRSAFANPIKSLRDE